MIPDPDDTAPQPHWDRAETETAKSYQAFTVYRDIGLTRSLRKAAARYYHSTDDVTQVTEPQLHQFKTWSSTHGWVDRAAAWDSHLEALRRAQQIEDVHTMNDAHAQLARNSLAKVIRWLNGIGDEQVKDWSPAMAMRVLDVASKLERLALGEPDSITRESPLASDDAHAAKVERANAAIDELERQRQRNAASG